MLRRQDRHAAIRLSIVEIYRDMSMLWVLQPYTYKAFNNNTNLLNHPPLLESLRRLSGRRFRYVSMIDTL